MRPGSVLGLHPRLFACAPLGLEKAPSTVLQVAYKIVFCIVGCFCLLSLFSCSSSPAKPNVPPAVTTPASDAEVDDGLQRAAVTALGEREGAIIVMDAQSGRLRAIVNPRLAFEQTFPPGSAIKPFTSLAAMRAGLIDRESRRQCAGRYAGDGFEIVCSHPKSNTPFSPMQALAYSCNDFFAHTGERLSEGAFNATLSAFGFGERTGVNAGSENAGRLPRGEWSAREALGESENLLVTPIQLLTAYTALVNGGYLYQPEQSQAAGFTTHEKARISIASAHRAMLIEGMRGAIKYGTAAKAELSSLPLYLFGKTGTSTASNRFRTNGWFVGFAAEQTEAREPAPERVRLAVLVFLKRAHGAQCAELTRPVFEAFAKATPPQAKLQSQTPNSANPPSAIRHPQSTIFKVHLVRENITKTVALEDYVRGVVAAEASVEDETEARKAQVVASRTFALKNRGRHANEGYDFCSTTHCQRFIEIADCGLGMADCGKESAAVQRANKAVSETRGELLWDERGQVIDAYFHAACGGMTANLESLWGAPAPAYLRGVRDDYCATMPHHRWVQAIPAAQLAKALRRDPGSDVGARIADIIVTKRDGSGRAEVMTLEGERRRVLRGWDFKMIVGRALGWNLIKSSRFEVTRAGTNFIFRGSGFGHGLGLCQEGAHVMARRGMSYRQILAHYYPGTVVKSDGETGRRGDGEPKGAEVLFDGRASLLHLVAASLMQNQVLSSENFRVTFPGNTDRREVEEALRTLETVRAEIERQLKDAALSLSGQQKTELLIYPTTGDFTGATGMPVWVAAVTRGRTMHLQPLRTLQKRGVLKPTLRHEYVHIVIESLSAGRAPRWLAEGLAIHLAGEGARYAQVQSKKKLSSDELEKKLASPASAQEMRELYAAAWREVRVMMRAEGLSKIWQRVASAQPRGHHTARVQSKKNAG